MRCPECNAWSEVLETKMRDRGYKYRRYLCMNNHRFSTKEEVTVFPKTGRSRPTGVNPFNDPFNDPFGLRKSKD